MYNRVLTGAIAAEQRSGRWFVDAADLDRHIAETSSTPEPAA
jgi:hypothetical protein